MYPDSGLLFGPKCSQVAQEAWALQTGALPGSWSFPTSEAGDWPFTDRIPPWGPSGTYVVLRAALFLSALTQPGPCSACLMSTCCFLGFPGPGPGLPWDICPAGGCCPSTRGLWLTRSDALKISQEVQISEASHYTLVSTGSHFPFVCCRVKEEGALVCITWKALPMSRG